MHKEREISETAYKQIMSGEKSPDDFFTEAERWGYGAIPSMPHEQGGKYYIPYGISDSCD